MVSSTAVLTEHSHLFDECSLQALAQDARRELLRAGQKARLIYRPKVNQAFDKYKVTFKQFQAYRSKLPWYRRALLLYAAPNPSAAWFKSTFHFLLVLQIVEIVGLEYFDPLGTLLGPPPPPTAWVVEFGHAHHLIAFLMYLAFWIFLVGCALGLNAWVRRIAIKYENDPQFYLWAEHPKTGTVYRQG